MNDKKHLIFIDSDAFVALSKENDSNHARAVILLNQLLKNEVQFITSNYVFSETLTVISLRIGHKQAISFAEKLKAPDNGFEIKWVDAAIEEAAIAVFKKQTSKNTNFVDCTNMVFLKQLPIYAIFSFDEIYKKNGFQMLEGA